jgi:hypothetical protein
MMPAVARSDCLLDDCESAGRIIWAGLKQVKRAKLKLSIALTADARLSDLFVSFFLCLVVQPLLQLDARLKKKEPLEKIVVEKDARLVYSLHSFNR